MSPSRASFVIPAFNEEARLALSLPWLVRAARRLDDAEIVIIDDGSHDQTADLARAHLAGYPNASVVRMPWNQGKGAALRAGVSIANGDAVVLMDADLSVELDELPRLLAALRESDIVLGSRHLRGAEGRDVTMWRDVASRVFASVARYASSLDVSDTQCGFKAFRAPVAKLLFHLAKTNGFAFDVEVLALADTLGYRIAEIPIRWTAIPGSHVRPIRDPMVMVRDCLRVRRRYAGLEVSLDEIDADAVGERDPFRWVGETEVSQTATSVSGAPSAFEGRANGNGHRER